MPVAAIRRRHGLTATGGMTNSSGGMGMLGVGLGIIAAAWE